MSFIYCVFIILFTFDSLNISNLSYVIYQTSGVLHIICKIFDDCSFKMSDHLDTLCVPYIISRRRILYFLLNYLLYFIYYFILFKNYKKYKSLIIRLKS